MKNFSIVGTLVLALMSFDANARGSARLEGGREKTRTETREKGADLQTLRPELGAKSTEGNRTELKDNNGRRDRTVETSSTGSGNEIGVTCSLDNFGGVNTAAAARSEILQAGGCATNAEQKLSERAKAAAAAVANAAEAVRSDLGVSLKEATNEQAAAISAGAIQQFSFQKGISVAEAAQDFMDVCEKCAVFHKRICSESTVEEAVRILSRRN